MNWFRRQYRAIKRRYWSKRPKMPAPPKPYKPWRLLFWRRRAKQSFLPPPVQAYELTRRERLTAFFRARWLARFFRSFPMPSWGRIQWRRLLYGAPVLAVLFGVVYVGVALARQETQDVARWYVERANEAIKGGDKGKAVGFVEAAMVAKPERQEYQVMLAGLALDNGDAARAEAIFKALAPEDHRGLPQAHLAMARLMIAHARKAEKPANYWGKMEKQLLQIADVEGPVGVEASLMLGQYYSDDSVRQWERAMPYLRRSPPQSPGRMYLAMCAARLGDLKTSRWEAEECIRGCQARLQDDPADTNARLLIVQCREIVKDYPIAIDVLDQTDVSKATEANKVRLIRWRADLYRQWFQGLEADERTAPKENRKALQECIRSCRAKLQAVPADTDARVLIVKCCELLKDFPTAIDVLDQTDVAKATEANKVQLIRWRADLYRQWLQGLEADERTAPEENRKALTPVRFAVLQRALLITPDDPKLLVKLAEFSDPKSPEGAKARALLQDQLVKGINTGIAHLVLGLQAWRQGEKERAKAQFELAKQQLPNNSNILNNLAWALLHADPPQLENALEMADASLSFLPPNSPDIRATTINFKHTRGSILVKMKRWKEAIIDLEFALDGDANPDRVNIHNSLGDAYEALGDADLALAHRNAAKLQPKKSETK
jgi:tetratricopeptide (TPR) repeat protein